MDIIPRLPSVQTGTIFIQINIEEIYTYLDTVVTHTVFPLLLPTLTLRKF